MASQWEWSMGMVQATRLLLISANSEVKVHYEKYNGHKGPEHFYEQLHVFFFSEVCQEVW